MLAAGAFLIGEFHRLPDWTLPAFIFLVAVIIFRVVGRRFAGSASPAGASSQTTIQNASNTLVPSIPAFDATQHFRQAYTRVLTAGVEKKIRIAANQNQPNDHVGFLAKLIGGGLDNYLHDMTWAYIDRSQLLMLADLNERGGLMPLADAKPYYDTLKGSRVSCWVRSDAVKSAHATLKGMALQDQRPPGFLGVVVGVVAPAGNCGAG